MLNHVKTSPLVIILTVLLAACGGGGNDSVNVDRYTVSTTASLGGGIGPVSATVDRNANTSFVITPDANYGIASVTGCGGTLSDDNTTYTTGPITEDCTVDASFVTFAAAAAPTLSYSIKTFRFSWVDQASATHYRLLENPDGSSGYTQVGKDILQGTGFVELVVPLYARVEARYILQTCTGSSCLDSASVVVGDNLVKAIGYIKGSNTEEKDGFGNHVALSADGKTLAVSAPGEDGNTTGINGDEADNSVSNIGAVYLYRDSGSGWSQQAYVKASNTQDRDWFATSIALSADGTTLAVGAVGEASSATGINGDEMDNSQYRAGAAYVYRYSNGAWSQQAYVKASNTETGDNFGGAIALSADGNTLAVGATGEKSSATGINGDQTNNATGITGTAGAVYVYRYSSGAWSQQVYVKASNTETGDSFGGAVALSADGNTLAAGAIGEKSNATGIDGDQMNNSASNSGAVYVYRYSSGAWLQQAYVKASNTEAFAKFGNDLALNADGNTLAVAAFQEDRDSMGGWAPESGAAYIYRYNGSTWEHQAYLNASDVREGNEFGESIALSADGNTLVAGSRFESSKSVGINGSQADTTEDFGSLDITHGAAGAAYIFRYDGGAWSQYAFVKASNTDNFDQFGASVALSADGNTLAVGAINEDSNGQGISGDQTDNSASKAGAVYLY
ncbi:MAG: integrin [Gammaproteobacteria bacterium]|nr:integrin [Gammaproteobacteria bacterium]